MSWIMKTTEKELLGAFWQFIEEQEELLSRKEIGIWGASVRGTLLGILLERAGYLRFKYVDNDEQKWGKDINGYQIEAPRNMINKPDTVIIIPIEYSGAVREQLLRKGLLENIDFFVLEPKLNEKFIEEFFRPYTGKRLIFGESFLNEVSMEEQQPSSIRELLWEQYGKDDTKILSMNCMGMQSFYHMLRLQSQMGDKPEEVWIFLNYETLTEHHHLLSRTHHAEMLKILQNHEKIHDAEFDQYVNFAKQCAENYQIEEKYSPKRIDVMDEEARIANQKEYMKSGVFYDLNLQAEEVRYLRKILKFAGQEGIRLKGIMVPVNIELAQKYYGNRFMQTYISNNEKLRRLFLEHRCEWMDLGTILSADAFVSEITIADAVKQEGQKIFIKKLKNVMGE